MREDMAKVVSKRRGAAKTHGERKGYWRAFHKTLAEEQPKRESIRSKEWDDYGSCPVGVVVGYVRKQIGRSFDEVFSEIRKIMPAGNGHTSFERTLWNNLERSVIIDEKNRACYAERSHPWREHDMGFVPIVSYGRYGPVAYVDPRDGIIKAAPQYRKPTEGEKVPQVIRIGERTFKQCNGIWFELTMRPVVTTKVPYTVAYRRSVISGIKTDITGYDIFLGQLDSYSEYSLRDMYGTSKEYCVARRQLNSKCIRQLGLKGKKTREYKLPTISIWH